MIVERTHEDVLREQYFKLVPEIRRIVWYLEAETRYCTREIFQSLKPYEQLVIKSRVKECESAVTSLRRRQEGGTFDPEKALGYYSLLDLPDLAGVRVLVFPRARLVEVDQALRAVFTEWTPDPIPDGKGGILVPKYKGKCKNVSHKIQSEYQIVPMLIGLYWDVEHAAIYKPSPTDKIPWDDADTEPMEDLNTRVVQALLDFEAGFERLKSNAS
jgi:hypothetical protein